MGAKTDEREQEFSVEHYAWYCSTPPQTAIDQHTATIVQENHHARFVL